METKENTDKALTDLEAHQLPTLFSYRQAYFVGFKAGETFSRKDERLLLASKLGGLIEICDWSEEGLRDFRKGIEAKLEEWDYDRAEGKRGE